MCFSRLTYWIPSMITLNSKLAGFCTYKYFLYWRRKCLFASGQSRGTKRNKNVPVQDKERSYIWNSTFKRKFRDTLIAAAILKAIEKLREEGWAALQSFFDSPQLSVSFNVQEGGKTLVFSFALQNTSALQATNSPVWRFRSTWLSSYKTHSSAAQWAIFTMMLFYDNCQNPISFLNSIS